MGISDQDTGTPATNESVSPWHDPIFAMLLIGALIFGAIYMSHFSVLPLIVTKAAGVSDTRLGILMGLSGLITVMFEISLNQFLMRFRALPVVIFG